MMDRTESGRPGGLPELRSEPASGLGHSAGIPDAVERWRMQLLILLAVIHRDGGRYVVEHGPEKAVEDAIRVVSDLIHATHQAASREA